MSPRFAWVAGLAWTMVAATIHAANTVSMAVTATVLSKSSCKFPNGAIALAFGAVDPSGSSNAVASTSATFSCAGSTASATFLITQDGGLHNASGNRLQHATVLGAFLPYTLSLTPSTGTVPKNVIQTLTIAGAITPVDYRQAIAGNYADTVTLTIAP